MRTTESSWVAAALTDEVVRQVAADHPDLGVADLETSQLDPATAWTGAGDGNEARLAGYDIGVEHSTPSAAPFAQLDRAHEREEPVHVHLYQPRWVFAQCDVTKLEEPNPYEEGCSESVALVDRDLGGGVAPVAGASGW